MKCDGLYLQNSKGAKSAIINIINVVLFLHKNPAGYVIMIENIRNGRNLMSAKR